MIKKRNISLLLLAFFMFFIFSPVNYAAADNASAIATIASEIEYYYSFADEYNKGALKDAQDALDGLTE